METKDPVKSEDPAAEPQDKDAADAEGSDTKDPASGSLTDDKKDGSSQTDQKTTSPASDSGKGTGAKVTVTPKTQSSQPSSSAAKTSKAPKTGDTSELLLWGAMLTLAGGAGVTLTLGRKRES